MYLFFPLTLVRVCYFRDPTKLKTPTRHIMNLNFWTFVPKHEKKIIHTSKVPEAYPAYPHHFGKGSSHCIFYNMLSPHT